MTINNGQNIEKGVNRQKIKNKIVMLTWLLIKISMQKNNNTVFTFCTKRYLVPCWQLLGLLPPSNGCNVE